MIRVNSQLFLPTSTDQGENYGKPKLKYLSTGEEVNIPTEDTIVTDMTLSYSNGNLTITLKNSSGKKIVSKTIAIGTGGGNVYT